MPDFSNGVATPGGASYMAPLLNFQQFANWPQQYEQGVLSEQQRQANIQRQQLTQQQIEQGKRQEQLAKAFPQGLPTDPQTGQIDYRQVAATLAKYGDVGDAVTILQQQPAPLSPLFGGPSPAGQGGPAGGGAAQPATAGASPASVQARPLPPPARNAPPGDSGQNTVTSLVTDRLPAQNQTTGETILKIAQTMGIDPNADLTPGQLRRAQGLLQKYAPEVAGMKVADASGRTGGLPPSANAGTPAASAPEQGSFNDRFAAARPGGQAPAAPPQPAPQPQGGGPITPQVPLPKGFNDPQAAIQALRTEAARLSQYPRAQGQVQQLNNWADRIEESTKPLQVNSMTTMVDPRTGKTLFQGPGAAALAASEAAQGSPTLDADAENYRLTGKLPPNMGRGIQGNVEAKAIRSRAVELERESGGDPGDWAQRWQNFGTQAAGQRVLATRAVNLRLAENEASTLIPRVRDISNKINRTQYPTLNSLILAAEKGSGGEDVIKYGLAVSSLIPVYARVLKPTGQITEGDTNRAREILDKAWSKGQINAALDQMELELKSAKEALQKTIDESSGKKKTEASGASSATRPDADGWVSLPNGARIREVKP